MNCIETRARLDQFVDDGLTGSERPALTAHLAECPACRDQLARLRSLLADAAALPRRLDPGRDLWPGIETRLPGRDQGRVAPLRHRPVWRLMAAGVALMVLSSAATLLWVRRSEGGAGELAAIERRYARATAELANRLDTQPGGLTAPTLAIVQRSLAIVDSAINEARAALAADRGNPELEKMLEARYQQRLELLRRANRLARGES